MPRDWRERVKTLSNVQRLVHLAMRQTADDSEQMRRELVKVRRRAYEDEITIQAGRLGCSEGKGRLKRGPALTAMNEQSKGDAASIINTYNYSLAVQIETIGKQVKSANRNTYASRLGAWDSEYAKAKAVEVAQWTEGTARRQAQQDFVKLNDLQGHAVLHPRRAAEHICQGWVNRGKVPIKEAMANPPPYHGRCPHAWVTTFKPRRKKKDCSDLWLG
jgi:hypothetical protein